MCFAFNYGWIWNVQGVIAAVQPCLQPIYDNTIQNGLCDYNNIEIIIQQYNIVKHF